MLQFLDTLNHIASLLSLIVGLFVAFLVYRAKAWFYEWLVEFNKELDDRYVSVNVYRVEHPHSQPHRRHAE